MGHHFMGFWVLIEQRGFRCSIWFVTVSSPAMTPSMLFSTIFYADELYNHEVGRTRAIY